MLRYLASVSSLFSATTNLPARNTVTSLDFDYRSLEERRLLAGINFDLPTGHITITGSAGNDVSYVTNPRVGEVRVSLTGFTAQTFNASEVTRIFFHGLEGDDFFKNETSIDAEAFGGDGNDRLFGGSGNDRLEGGDGDDILSGGDGNDTLIGGRGNDRLNAGAGNDFLDGGEGNDKLFGISGNNLHYGGDGDDEIWGGTGNDEIWGGAGNDFINTGGGTNFVDAGAGDDIVFSGQAISNFIIGGEGDDYLLGGNGNDRIEGGGGNDRLFGGGGDDIIFGGDGNDIIRGGTGADYLDGGEGDDTIFGDDGDDTIIGGAGNDRLIGGNGNDRILGDAGDDEIQGGAGDDEIYGGDGDDLIYGGDGDDVIRAGAGNDRVFGQAGDDIIYGQDGDDLLNGGSGNDILHGQEGNDRLIGGEGNDRLYGGNGNDFLSAGSGNNGLFGGLLGTKQLVGGSGKNRFLIHESTPTELFSFKMSDARILFRNGLRQWSNTEIRVVDDMLHEMHMRGGNTRILKGTFTNKPVVFIKELTVASNRFGSNEFANQEHQIRLPEWDEFDETSNLIVRPEVAREIAYNWASDEAMQAAYSPLGGIFPRFQNISGWTNVQPPQELIAEYYKSQDNQWWYFKVAKFTETYSTFNPAADFAASWKFYFDPQVTPEQRVEFIERMEIIDEVFEKLSPF